MLASSAMAAPLIIPQPVEMKETSRAIELTSGAVVVDTDKPFELNVVCYNVLGIPTKGYESGEMKLSDHPMLTVKLAHPVD